MNTETPLVTVSCTAYNHENFIRDALEGFVMQKTNFLYEVIVHDDASTDRTTDIIKEYELKYPDLIKPIYQKENQWSKGIRPSANFIWPKIKSKYVAICEGDDYWIDPLKLQKQVDYLESNAAFSMCYHSHSVQINNSVKTIPKSANTPDSITLYDYTKSNYHIQSGTVLLRNLKSVFKIYSEFNDKITGSYFLFLLFSEKGKIKFINEVMSVYRKHEGGIWSGKDKFEQGSMELKNKRAMLEYFSGNKSIYNNIRKTYIKKALFYGNYFLAKKDFTKAKLFYKSSFEFGISITHFDYSIKVFILKLFKS